MNKPRNADNWARRLLKRFRQDFKWLAPGMGYKRWLVLTIIGSMLLGLGAAVLVLEFYRTAMNKAIVPILAVLSLRFLDRPIRFLLFGGLGMAMILIGIWGANRSLLRPFERSGKPIWDTLKNYRQREKGIKVVVIGGGHGLAALLRGLKEYTHNITAIVTVADDGGSSGELRRELGVLPPGDVRNCLSALSSDEALLSQVFQYRFTSGAGLEGHSLGNLFITALSEITGSFEEAVAESGRVLAIYGQVLPSTLSNVQLVGQVRDEATREIVEVWGEAELTSYPGKILKVWLDPPEAPTYPPTISAILNADLILIGPGSLYTSLLPNLLVKGLSDAILASRAETFYICNIATEMGETDGFSAADHAREIDRHICKNLFSLAICNRNYHGDLGGKAQWVKLDDEMRQNYRVYEADLVDDLYPWRHSSRKLARVIMNLFEERTGPLN